jgi:hypothetical protein
MLASLNLPADLQPGYLVDPDTRALSVSTLSAPDGSWCEVDLTSRRVREGGATPLWQHVERAFAQWQRWDEPDWGRFGLTVTPERHSIWLDKPTVSVAELDPVA